MPSMEFPVAIIPGGVGYGELLLLFALILVIFGPTRLPDIARKLGKVLEQLRTAASLFQQNLLSMDDDANEDISGGGVASSSDQDKNGGKDGPSC